jgi:hypothetical protein
MRGANAFVGLVRQALEGDGLQDVKYPGNAATTVQFSREEGKKTGRGEDGNQGVEVEVCTR